MKYALIFFIATSAFAGWSSSGPTGGAVTAVVVAPSDPAVIWAGNAAGVFRSADGGATWSNVSGPVAEVDYLAVHPTDPAKAWVVTGFTPVSRVWRTTDAGATWIDSNDGLPLLRPSALLVDPRNPDTLYLGSNCEPIAKVATGPVAINAAGVFKSTDGGATWKAVFGGVTSFQQCTAELSLDPFSPWRLFASVPFSGTAQMESYDNGQTWEPAAGGRPSLAVVFDARFPFTHYGIGGGFGAKMFVSQDGGFTWNAVNGKLPANPTALSMDPERSRIFLATTNGVFRSGNGGTVWAPTSVLPVGVSAIDFGGEPRSLFAATSAGLLQVMNRGLGESRPIDLHDIAANVTAIAVDPSDSNVVYAGVREPYTFGDNAGRGRVYRSTNGGASWERLPNDDPTPRGDYLAVDAAGTLYAGMYSGTLYRRARGETAWTVIHTGGVNSLVADPKNAGTVFLSAYGGGVSRTRDGGKTWQIVLHSFGYLAIDPNDPRWVYAGNEFELWRSGDGGETWTNLITKFDPETSGTRGIVVAPTNGKTLYRIGAHGGRPRTERSDDRGSTWTPFPLPGEWYPSAIAVDPRYEYSVWAATFNGVLYHSTNGGSLWQKIDAPFLTAGSAIALSVDASGHVLHVAYPSHGVWELRE
jgi:photosystem II stability/assembly factor-like uncharacterized protein